VYEYDEFLGHADNLSADATETRGSDILAGLKWDEQERAAARGLNADRAKDGGRRASAFRIRD